MEATADSIGANGKPSSCTPCSKLPIAQSRALFLWAFSQSTTTPRCCPDALFFRFSVTPCTYVTYHHPNGKQFEIEHIWANKFEEHKDEFEQENDFQRWRNSIGALILLPVGTNQSFNSDKYEDKVRHYLKENTYAQTLNQEYYLKNPNFLKSKIIQCLGFKAHAHFKKDDIIDRKSLVQRICENLWSVDYFNSNNEM